MKYTVRNDLSYCVVDGHAIFLDVAADRYFHLPDHLERAFIEYVSASDRNRSPEAALVERNIMVRGEQEFRDAAQSETSAPSRSASEMAVVDTGDAVRALPEVMMTTWRCRRRIRTWPLREVIDETLRYRAQHCSAPRTSCGAAHERRLLRAVDVFQRARLYLPLETRCLLDSLSLFRFLARRGLDSKIVLGVTNDPFAAHCWVQSGNIVLNDTVGNAMAHTIIKVI